MNKKISLGAAVALLFVAAAVVFSATMVYSSGRFGTTVNNLKQREVMYEKYAELDRLVRGNYIGEIDDVLLLDSVARGYLGGTGDPYATYLSAEEYKKRAMSTEGDNVGIGAVIDVSPDNYLLVKEVYPDSPAQQAGMEAGDLIVKVDDTSLPTESPDQQLAAIDGPQGSVLTIVLRRGNQELTPTELTRRSVPAPTVYARMIENTEIGYVNIREFGDHTSNQLNRDLQKLIDAGAQSIIFDVRDNKGGSMPTLYRILDKLCPEGKLGMAHYRDGSVKLLGTSDPSSVGLPMIVLVNAGTESGGELFAQDLKDLCGAPIVGQTTFGKGVLQDIIRLSDGSAIELTVAYITSAADVEFNTVGIKPDYEVSMESEWQKLNELSDLQLKKAMEIAAAAQHAATTEVEAVEEPPADS